MKYRSPDAFKTALLEMLKKESASRQIPFLRVQMRLLFERLLVRAQAVFPHLVIKGGAAMEFRLSLARTTRDLDFGLYGVAAEGVLPRLQESGQADFEDYLSFEIQDDPKHPVLEAEGMQYQGRRLRVRARLAGKPLFGYFGVDVAVGEPAAPSEQMKVPSLLAAAGLAPLELTVYALESHIAEKFHAYTLPRSHPNSRVKDLPDLGLLAMHRPILGDKLRQALEKTFGHRRTHELLRSVPMAPVAWAAPYASMAKENALPWRDLASVQDAVGNFLNPILELSDSRVWTPRTWSWEEGL